MRKHYADMDPVEEIRAIRADIMLEFKTLGAYYDYLEGNYPTNPPSRKSRRNSTKADNRPASRRRKQTIDA